MAELDALQKEKRGFFDYNDLTTASTPISITGGGGYIDLTNDGAGTFTELSYAPTTVTSIYTVGTHLFDWSDLSLGDEIQIRLDVEVVTASVNTQIDARLLMANGGTSYGISWINPIDIKATGTHPFTKWNGVYMGNSDTLTNTAKFQMQADKTCTVKILGWYVSVQRR